MSKANDKRREFRAALRADLERKDLSDLERGALVGVTTYAQAAYAAGQCAHAESLRDWVAKWSDDR